MKTKWMTRVMLAGVLLTGVLMTSGSLLAESHWSVGIGIGTLGAEAAALGSVAGLMTG